MPPSIADSYFRNFFRSHIEVGELWDDLMLDHLHPESPSDRSVRKYGMEHEDVRVKICGVTRPEDARVAEAAGADAVGVVMFSDSPRSISPDEAAAVFSALGSFVARVVVTHTTSPEDLARVLALRPTAVQVSYPHEVPVGCGTQVIRVIGRECPAPPLCADAYIVDESMGRGRLFDPAAARSFVEESQVPVVLAGGLTPENVRAAVEAVRPFAVDVCSGVEAGPGVKDPALVRAFVRAVKGRTSGSAEPASRRSLRF